MRKNAARRTSYSGTNRKGGRIMFRRKSYPDWAAVLAAFGLLLGAAAPWFALVLSIPPPAVQADAQVLTDEGGGLKGRGCDQGGRSAGDKTGGNRSCEAHGGPYL